MSAYTRRCAIQLLRELGVPLPKRALTAEQEAQVLARLQRGDLYRAVAKDFGVSRQTLWRLLRRFKQSQSQDVPRGT